MELFRACCGCSLLRAVDDTHEIKQPRPKRPPKRVFCQEAYWEDANVDQMLRQTVRITRVKCHGGDDSHPESFEDVGSGQGAKNDSASKGPGRSIVRNNRRRGRGQRAQDAGVRRQV